VAHELKAGRGAWLQIAEGALTLNGTELATGDGASTEAPGVLTLTAKKPNRSVAIRSGLNQRRSRGGLRAETPGRCGQSFEGIKSDR
jgi:redox-sensitive bicupin YhaK (pirin superfamily)